LFKKSELEYDGQKLPYFIWTYLCKKGKTYEQGASLFIRGLIAAYNTHRQIRREVEAPGFEIKNLAQLLDESLNLCYPKSQEEKIPSCIKKGKIKHN